MKKTLFFIFSIVVSQARSQNIPIRQDYPVQWSASSDKVVNLTSKYHLKKWYLDKEKVTARQEWLNGFNAEVQQAGRTPEWYFVDATKPLPEPERVKYHGGALKLIQDQCCGCDEADAFRVHQILSYKNGKFSIQNVFISPLCAKQNGSEKFDWYPFTDVAYNDNAARTFPGASKDVVLLNTNEIDYNFDPEDASVYDSVLTIHGTDIGSLIYQDILKGNLKAVDAQTGKLISPKSLLSMNNYADTMAVYDINDPSRIVAYSILHKERSSTELNRIRIKQDLYFDFKNERLYSVVRSVTLMMAVRLPDGQLRGVMPFCRLE